MQINFEQHRSSQGRCTVQFCRMPVDRASIRLHGTGRRWERGNEGGEKMKSPRIITLFQWLTYYLLIRQIHIFSFIWGRYVCIQTIHICIVWRRKYFYLTYIVIERWRMAKPQLTKLWNNFVVISWKGSHRRLPFQIIKTFIGCNCPLGITFVVEKECVPLRLIISGCLLYAYSKICIELDDLRWLVTCGPVSLWWHETSQHERQGRLSCLCLHYKNCRHHSFVKLC